MKFLVVGASGFLGSRLFKQLSKNGSTVTGTRHASSDQRLLKFDLSTDRLSDILPSSVRDSKDRFYAIICATIRQIDRVQELGDKSRAVNVDGTKRLIDDIVRLNSVPVFLSTSYVFDGEKGNYKETDACDPVCAYGSQKRAVESYLLEKHPTSLIVRLDKIVGDSPAEPHLFSEWLQTVNNKQPIRCIKGQIFSPTLVTDIAPVIETLCRNNARGIYHAANSESYRRADLAKLFLKSTGLSADVQELEQAAFSFSDKRPLNTTMDTSKLVKETGASFTPVSRVLAAFASAR